MIEPIFIPKPLCSALEQRILEQDGLKALLRFAYAETKYQIPQEKIDFLEKEYIRITKEYEILKTFVWDYVPVEISRDLNWSIDFETRLLKIEGYDYKLGPIRKERKQGDYDEVLHRAYYETDKKIIEVTFQVTEA